MSNVKAFAAESKSSPLQESSIPRRANTADDVAIDILFCGICHSDLHTARDEWNSIMPTVYPCVPGHEIVGRVTSVGANVSKFKVGDVVGVGCLVDSDGECPNCKDGFEQFCPNGTFTYNSVDRHETAPVTYGGYSESIVVDQDFVLRIPDNLDLAGAAPLLCAGITTYSPLKRAKVGPGMNVGVVGLGGLGHMAVKLAKAMGARVTVFSTSPSKIEDAKRLGADEVVISTDAEAMAAKAWQYDFILDAVSADHDVNAYIQLLARGGTMTLVGAPEKPMPVSSFALLFGNKTLNGSLIGGLAETQEMLDFCGKHGIVSDVEVIKMQDVNAAYERMLKSDVKYRFCIDMSSLKNA